MDHGRLTPRRRHKPSETQELAFIVHLMTFRFRKSKANAMFLTLTPVRKEIPLDGVLAPAQDPRAVSPVSPSLTAQLPFLRF